MAAPFWRINNHVYDLFHVPAYFRVESYTALTIPKVSHSFDNYIFQCFLIDHTTDQIKYIPGVENKLTVIKGTIINGNLIESVSLLDLYSQKLMCVGMYMKFIEEGEMALFNRLCIFSMEYSFLGREFFHYNVKTTHVWVTLRLEDFTTFS